MKDFKEFCLKMLIGLVLTGVGTCLVLGLFYLLSYLNFSVFTFILSSAIMVISFILGTFVMDRFKNKKQ